MCIAVWIWQSHPLYPLILLFNRDEYQNRPTMPVGWWGFGHGDILSGKDMKGGGTWMGCTRDGKLAFLTNYREPGSSPTAKTRGNLTIKFLEGTKSPLEYAEEVTKEADLYNGFNLVLADLRSKTMVYVTNRPKRDPVPVQVVSPGIHTLSNANLDVPWPKALSLGKNFEKFLVKYDINEVPVGEMLEQLMGDRTKASRDTVPLTGCSPDWEFELSSICVETDTELGRCGTRSQTALLVKLNGDVSLHERYLEENTWKELTFEFHIEKMRQEYLSTVDRTDADT